MGDGRARCLTAAAFFFVKLNTILMMDNLLTSQIEAFLAVSKPTDEQIREGAMLLLRVNPGARGIYNSAMARPQAMLPWVVEDLKKFLAIRKRGLERQQVARFNAETVTRVRETLSRVPDTVVEHAGKANTASLGKIPDSGIRGKRADHDSLPENIQHIWEENAERWKKMRSLHAQLEVMVAKPGYQACDGNEICHVLRETDTLIRNEYKRYDTYRPGDTTAKDSVETFTDNVKTIQNARAAITRGLQKKKLDDAARQKIQDAVNTLVALDQVLKPATVAKLKAIGVAVPNA